jgi:hypothetical protein
MKERPILFSAPMVRAILAGTKTQTRRAVKGWPLEWLQPGMFTPEYVANPGNHACPYGQPGDRLWVRETTHRRPMLNLLSGAPLAPEYDGGAYSASGEDVLTPEGFDIGWWYSRKACPSIHMPRWASRILLEVTGVRVERLQDISEADAQAEGCPCYVCGVPMDGRSEKDCHCFHAKAKPSDFRALWESINGADSWAANPWVWVVSFRRVKP